MKKPLRLQARDYDILRALLAYTALTLDLIEKFLFLEPGKTRSRAWHRTDKLCDHGFIMSDLGKRTKKRERGGGREGQRVK